MNDDDKRHGTARGYSAHRRAGVEPCDACRRAAADYERRRHYDSHLGRPRLIPVTGTRRRIRALQRMGWSADLIAQRLGHQARQPRDSIRNMLYEATYVTRSMAERVARVYDELCMTPGPSNITARRAERKGWAPPLAWNDIDDPDEAPNLGEPERRLSQQEQWAKVAAERLEDIEHVAAGGVSAEEIAQRVGLTLDSLQKFLERQRRWDLWMRIRPGDPNRDSRRNGHGLLAKKGAA